MLITTYDDARRLNSASGVTVYDRLGAAWVLQNDELSQHGRNVHVQLWAGASDAALPHGPFRVTVDSIPDDGARNLARRLMLQSAQENLSVANGLVEYHKGRADEACAILAMLRDGIAELCSSPYAPNPAYIRDLLWPSEDAVNAWIEANPAG